MCQAAGGIYCLYGLCRTVFCCGKDLQIVFGFADFLQEIDLSGDVFIVGREVQMDYVVAEPFIGVHDRAGICLQLEPHLMSE